LEQFVYVGWLTALLAIAGVVLLARSRHWLAAVLAIAAVVPLLLSLGTNLPGYAELHGNFAPLRFTRVPGRFMPIADLAIAALAAFAVAVLLARVPRRRFAIAAAALVALVAADLLVFPLRGSTADQDNAAYADLAGAGAGRVLEFPVFRPGEGAGSAYYVYELQAPRERPTGYSTVAPREAYEVADELARLDCGIWLPGDEARLQNLEVNFVALHLGLYERVENDAAWFAWTELETHGFGPIASNQTVTLFGRDRSSSDGPPFSEPSRSKSVHCYATADQAGAWVWAGGDTELTLGGSSEATVWIDGELHAANEPFSIVGRGWHSVFVQGPGVRLEELAISPS
jgi:hypothetical protein